MQIAALVKTSLIDYPGLVAAVVFTQGCNLRCNYCHNPALLNPGNQRGLIPETEVLGHLERRKGVLDGLTLTGGEPTLQAGLEEFLGQVKKRGFRVKLDTNGTSPWVLERLIRGKLLDYVAMDLKAPREKYPEICGKPLDMAAIGASIDLLRDAGVPHEFRTTLAPGLEAEDLQDIKDWIGGASNWVLQRYRAADRTGVSILGPSSIRESPSEFQARFGPCRLRGF
jgi:pyruvate formate lyase activating enzyme